MSIYLQNSENDVSVMLIFKKPQILKYDYFIR